MRQGFRPTLEPPKHRTAVVEARRPSLCLVLAFCVTLLIFAIFGVSAWNVYEHRFNENDHYFHPNDEVALNEVNDDLSSVFCDGYTVTLYGRGQVFLLSDHATVNTTPTNSEDVWMSQMPYRPLNVRNYFLLLGSIINVTACHLREPAGPGARILLIRGDDNFHEWRRNSKCSDCILDNVEIPVYDICSNNNKKDNPAKLFHKVTRNDKHFLVIYYGRFDHEQNAEIRLSGKVWRTHFDVSRAEGMCNTIGCHEGGPEHDCRPVHCYFDLPWLSQKDIVVKLEDFPMDHRNFTTQCQPRDAFWICLFGVVPIVVVVPVSGIFAWFLCRRTKRNANAIRKRQEQRRHREKHPITKDGHGNYVAQNEDYGSVAIQDE